MEVVDTLLSTRRLLVACLVGHILMLLVLYCLQHRIRISCSVDSRVLGRFRRTGFFQFGLFVINHFVHIDVEDRCELLVRVYTTW